MHKKERGSLLIGAAITVAIVGMLLAFWGQRQFNEWRIMRGERVGESLKILGNGVESFIARYETQILSRMNDASSKTLILVDDGGNKIPNGEIKDIYSPTAKEIILLMHLKGVSEEPLLAGAKYLIKLEKVNNQVHALTFIDKVIPSFYGSHPDYVATGAAIQKIGVNGGMAMLNNGTKISFGDGRENPLIDINNPLNNKPGILAIRGGGAAASSMSLGDDLLPLSGKKEMRGNLKIGGKNIENVKNIESGGNIYAKGDIESRGNIFGANYIEATGTGNSAGIWGRKNVIAGYSTVNSLPSKIKINHNVLDGNVIVKEAIIAGNYKGKVFIPGKYNLFAGDERGGAILASGNIHSDRQIVSNNSIFSGENIEALGQIKARGGNIIATTKEKKSEDPEMNGHIIADRMLQSREGVLHLKGVNEIGGRCTKRTIGMNGRGKLLTCDDSNRWQGETAPLIFRYISPYCNIGSGPKHLSDMEQIMPNAITFGSGGKGRFNTCSIEAISQCNQKNTNVRAVLRAARDNYNTNTGTAGLSAYYLHTTNATVQVTCMVF